MELAKEGEGSAINMDDFQITLSSGTSVVSFKRRRFDDGEETEQERMEMKEIKLDMWKMKKDLMDGKEDMKKEIQKMHQMKKEIQEAREELTADRNKLEEDRKIFERVECEREKLRKDQARNEEECQRIRMEADRQIEEKLGELSKSRENLQQSWRDLPPNDQVPDPQPVQAQLQVPLHQIPDPQPVQVQLHQIPVGAPEAGRFDDDEFAELLKVCIYSAQTME